MKFRDDCSLSLGCVLPATLACNSRQQYCAQACHDWGRKRRAQTQLNQLVGGATCPAPAIRAQSLGLIRQSAWSPAPLDHRLLGYPRLYHPHPLNKAQIRLNYGLSRPFFGMGVVYKGVFQKSMTRACEACTDQARDSSCVVPGWGARIRTVGLQTGGAF